MEVGTKIKGKTDFYKDIKEAEIKEMRFHMAKVKITQSPVEAKIGTELVVLLNEFDLAE